MSGAQECLKKTVTELQDSLSKDEDLVKVRNSHTPGVPCKLVPGFTALILLS